jgi:hypothetical protein
MRYLLIAERGTTTNMVRIEADSDELAQLEAVFKIMRAAPTLPLWARGEITLKREDGEVIARMPAKEDI